jgi:pyruvate kinase
MSIITKVKLLKYRRTKIVATLGPASDTRMMITQLIKAGVNVFRLNMSHNTHESHARNYQYIREIAKELKAPIGVLVDLSGPKIRTGRFEGGQISLLKDDSVIVTVADVIGKQGLIPSQYKALVNDVVTGNRILLNDGALELEVLSIMDQEIACKVIIGGILKDHKGINLPGVNVSAPSLTEKDIMDANFALDLGADFLALSFVRRAEDVRALRSLIHARGGTADIIAKIEKPEALENFNEILDASDGIMIARGDLGVELPPEEVPAAQDQLIKLARAKGKPVIVATQMLESMILNSTPTRAEVTDVSHAVNSGADAVMLSAESASGEYPVKSVQMMDRIARRAEAFLWKEGKWGVHSFNANSFENFSAAIASATARISKDLMAHAVFVVSRNRKSSIMMSSARPAAPIIAITANERDYHLLSILWGVIAFFEKDLDAIDTKELVRKIASDLGLASAGHCILLVSGFNDDPLLNAPSVTAITV